MAMVDTNGQMVVTTRASLSVAIEMGKAFFANQMVLRTKVIISLRK